MRLCGSGCSGRITGAVLAARGRCISASPACITDKSTEVALDIHLSLHSGMPEDPYAPPCCPGRKVPPSPNHSSHDDSRMPTPSMCTTPQPTTALLLLQPTPQEVHLTPWSPLVYRGLHDGPPPPSPHTTPPSACPCPRWMDPPATENHLFCRIWFVLTHSGLQHRLPSLMSSLMRAPLPSSAIWPSEGHVLPYQISPAATFFSLCPRLVAR